MLKENFIQTLQASIRKHWNLPAFSDHEGPTLNYSRVAEKIIWLHTLFHEHGIRKGEKIALLGKNCVNWGLSYLAVITYGAVIVPILPDFHTDDIHHIVNHSDSRFLFVADALYENLDNSKMQKLDAVFSLTNFSLLYSNVRNMSHILKKAEDRFAKKDRDKLQPEKIQFNRVDNKELAAIVYTSGTTGFSKGVMLPHNSLMANVRYAREHMPLRAGDTIVSFLPLAHSFGCAFEFLFPFAVGCHITFLSRTPSPKIILDAFAGIHPRLILSVPLVIERIYHKQIKPLLKKAIMKLLFKLPFIEGKLRGKIRDKLSHAFGNNFMEIIVGGAAFNPEVEAFLKKIEFPFTVGYGMTECGPLISYTNWKTYRSASVGQLVDTLEVRIDSPDPYRTVGEIMVRGENVMQGYYKNPVATKETIDKAGWLHTGDLGLIDQDGFIFIKGRCKSMILGASGQNIYPEEIEAKLNNMPFVQESLVIEKDGKLIAMVYPDMELVDSKGVNETELNHKMDQNRMELNSQLPVFSQISKIDVYPEEFEKTATKKIKRFLYSIPS
ncbi:MAG: AMP-binding protein [bacterium]|nr:AMP-binding protein [bacterium]